MDGPPSTLKSAHVKLERLFQHWRSLHPEGGLPGRRDLDPAAISELLPNVSLVEVHGGPRRFRYRLLGSCVDAVLGKTCTGLWLDELYAAAPMVLKQYDVVVETGQPFWRRGAPHLPVRDCKMIEVLRLPLGADGKTVDMVLSLSVYFDAHGHEIAVNRLRNR